MFHCSHLRTSAARVLAAFAAAAVLSLTTGCALESSVPYTPEATVVSLHGMKGTVMGGQQPVYNATIGLYAPGFSGTGSSFYGQASASVNGGVTTTTDINGNFSLTGTITCPTGNPPIFLTATGGDPTDTPPVPPATTPATNNTAIQLVAPLGPCSSISTSTSVVINEVTTVATAFSLAQFVGGFGVTAGSAAPSIGAPSTNQVGLFNAFATAHNLITSNGYAAPTGTPATGTNYFLFANDAQKLYTMANIIAACVNSTSNASTQCSTLFTHVAPPGSTAPTDVFQAAAYMALNPTSNTSSGTSNSAANITALMNNAGSTPPYGYVLASNPSDWTIAVQYTNTSTFPGAILYLSGAAIDSNGDLWFSNATGPGGSSGTNGTGTGGAVHLFGGYGGSSQTVPSGSTLGTAGSVVAFVTGDGTHYANGTRGLTIDQANNVWFGGYNEEYLFRASSAAAPTVTSWTTGSSTPYAIAIDGNDLVTATTGTSNAYTIAATALSATSTVLTTGVTAGGGAASLAITSGTSSPTAYAPTKSGSNVFEFTTASTPTKLTSTTGVSDSFSVNYGSAIDGNNNVWIANTSNPGALIMGTGTGLTGTTFTTESQNACMVDPLMVAVDGGNNIWVSNGSTTSTPTSVCEFNNSGTLISSASGYGLHDLVTARGIAIDQSGNVWVTNYQTGASNVTEIVGAAVPTINPISVALKNGTVGTRP